MAMAVPSPSSTLKNAALRAYNLWRTLKFDLRRKYFVNPPSRKRFIAQGVKLSPAQEEVLRSLRERGVAFVRFEDLFRGSGDEWRALERGIGEFVDGPKVREEVAAYKVNYASGSWKEYLVRRFADGEAIATSDPMIRVGLRPEILDVVNSYLELWSKLIAANMWYTIPLDAPRERIASQNWHRDPEDTRLVKVFLYFSDVDESAGPLEYIPSSRPGGARQDIWPMPMSLLGHYAYPPTEIVDARVPEGERVRCVCARGTLVFVDTSGLHRGGFAIRNPRILATWAYVSPSSLAPRIFHPSSDAAAAPPEGAAAFALS